MKIGMPIFFCGRYVVEFAIFRTNYQEAKGKDSCHNSRNHVSHTRNCPVIPSSGGLVESPDQEPGANEN